MTKTLDTGQGQALAQVQKRLRFEWFEPLLATDPRILIGDVLLAAYRLDIPLTIRRRPNDQECDNIRDELRRGVQEGEYGRLLGDPDLERAPRVCDDEGKSDRLSPTTST